MTSHFPLGPRIDVWPEDWFSEKSEIRYWNSVTGIDTILDDEGLERYLPEIAALSEPRKSSTPPPFILVSICQEYNRKTHLATRKALLGLFKAFNLTDDQVFAWYRPRSSLFSRREVGEDGRSISTITISQSMGWDRALHKFRISDGACACLFQSLVDNLPRRQPLMETLKQLPAPCHPWHLISTLVRFQFAQRDADMNRDVKSIKDIHMRAGRLFYPKHSILESFEDDEAMLSKVHNLDALLELSAWRFRLLRNVIAEAEGIVREWEETRKGAVCATAGVGDGAVVGEEKGGREKQKADVEIVSFAERIRMEDEARRLMQLIKMNLEVLERARHDLDKLSQMVYGRIAQGNTRTNIHLASIAVADSYTMKTITVITLLFLPSTLIASIWQADIFTIEGSANWKAFFGTTLSVTAFVFAVWTYWLRYTRGSRFPITRGVGATDCDKERP